MLIPFSTALFIVGSYLCTINTQPTFSTAINQNFRWNGIHSVQPGSRGPFHLTPHFFFLFLLPSHTVKGFIILESFSLELYL